MSISTGHNKCIDFISKIKPEAARFAINVSHQLQTNNSCRLNVSNEELAVLVAELAYPEKIIVVADIALSTVCTNVAEAFGHSHRWYAITNELSDQERTGDIVTENSLAYHAVCSGAHGRFIVAPGLTHKPAPNPAVYQARTINLTVGERMTLTLAVHALAERGYNRHRSSLEPGSFRVRGEAVDIHHPLWEHTVTLEFSGSTIERIIATRNTRTTLTARIVIPPVTLPNETTSWQIITRKALVIRPSSATLDGQQTIITDSVKPQYTFSPQATATAKDLARCLLPPLETTLEKPLTYEQAFEIIGTLDVGKPAVHSDHGIGIFEGLQKRTIASYEKEYLVLRYAQGDALSVPVEFAHKITPYVGQTHPPIHRLHGAGWKKARRAAHSDAAAFAQELLAIAGQRSETSRPVYYLSPQVEQELDATFPHELTDDQVRTWQEVRADLQKEIPMDRLVVGDVGFGKTEIAYRAARHVIARGKQVAMLAPTTLLVQQHFDLFSQRLPKQSGSVHLLSRFISTTQKKQTQQAIASGQANIVVGTHGLLSPTVAWHNLGLVIIDEEQRFGVKQKERFKQIRAAVDVLSLSATPIPRTLSMALSGLRSLSLIATPPVGRKSVQTFVGRLSAEKLQEAMNQELSRGGQIYVVAPKIRQLSAIQHQIKALFPDVVTAIAHGRTPDEKLSDIIHNFDSGAVRILISSSIVEHGLDLAGANTMIIFHAPSFGLSELYQLRGRIGRRERQGYAYFFYNQQELTPIQRDRLTALTEASRLGSGWQLARRDLEIRGAGNLLGADQSGSVNAVGVQLYLDMIRQATSGETAERDQADVSLPFPALLPADYVSDTDERTAWYIRLTRARTSIELDKRTRELERTFGQLPPETQNLMLTLKLQRAATANNIQKIHTKKISPPDEDPYDRIIVDTTNAPVVLAKLSSLGNWRVRGSSLTWDVDAVTPQLVEKLINSLS